MKQLDFIVAAMLKEKVEITVLFTLEKLQRKNGQWKKYISMENYFRCLAYFPKLNVKYHKLEDWLDSRSRFFCKIL